MTRHDRKRLAKILGRLGSGFPNERDVAAQLAAKMVRESNETWKQILVSQDGVAEEACRVLYAENERLRAQLEHMQMQVQRATPAPSFDPDDPREQHDLCLRWRHRLSEWERNFVLSLGRFRRWSPKQRDVLRRIAAKCDALARGHS